MAIDFTSIVQRVHSHIIRIFLTINAILVFLLSWKLFSLPLYSIIRSSRCTRFDMLRFEGKTFQNKHAVLPKSSAVQVEHIG